MNLANDDTCKVEALLRNLLEKVVYSRSSVRNVVDTWLFYVDDSGIEVVVARSTLNLAFLDPRKEVEFLGQSGSKLRHLNVLAKTRHDLHVLTNSVIDLQSRE